MRLSLIHYAGLTGLVCLVAGGCSTTPLGNMVNDVPGVVIPGAVTVGDLAALASPAVRQEGAVDGGNRLVGDRPAPPAEAAEWIIKQLASRGRERPE